MGRDGGRHFPKGLVEKFVMQIILSIEDKGWGTADFLDSKPIRKPSGRKSRRSHHTVIHAPDIFDSAPLHGLLLGADAPHDLTIFQ